MRIVDFEDSKSIGNQTMTTGTIRTLSTDEPVPLTIDKNTFNEQKTTDNFCDIPLEFFTVENNTVFLDEEFVNTADWIVYDDGHPTKSASLTTQRITIGEHTISVNPGICPIFVSEDMLN